MAKPKKIKLGKSGLPLASNVGIDFHETEEAMFAVYLLGKISIAWNYCEHVLSTLIWPHFGDVQKGIAVTSNLGNQSKADLLLTLVRKFETNKDVVQRIEFGTKAFNRLREIRNVLMHSHGIEQHDGEKFEWRRTSQKAKHGHTGSLASASDLANIEFNIKKLTSFLFDIYFYYLAIEKKLPLPELPQIFPIIDKLPSTLANDA